MISDTAFDFTDLKEKIKRATKNAFSEVADKHTNEGICAFALYSDEGAMTVCPSTNTIAHLSKTNPADLVYKFEPSEWKYEMVGADFLFNEISDTLCTHILSGGFDSDDEKAFTTFQETLYATCINVLIELKKEEFFKTTAGKDIFLTFSVTDYEFEKSALEEIISQLNNQETTEEYITWMKTWSQ